MTITHRKRAELLRKLGNDLLAIADQLEGLAPPKRAPSPDKAVVPWVGEALTLWRQAVGEVAAGRLGKALAPVVARDGWGKVRPVYECYLRDRPYQRRDGSIWGDKPTDTAANAVEPDRRWMSPEDFVKTFQTWRARVT